MPEHALPTTWGVRAAELYTPDYARRYREADDAIRHGELVTRFGSWLAQTCERVGRDIVALDLGCGTGRYFWALRGVRELVGVDVSAAMLAEAERPVDRDSVRVASVRLIQGDFLTVQLPEEHFDLVYSIGVLGEHAPFDTAVASRVHRWLRRGGRFAFTGVHRESFSVPRSRTRRLAETIMSWAPGDMASALRRRLLSGGLYVDEAYIESVLQASGFSVESLERHQSDVHLHCLCVARKVDR
jgi:ubiquinone/menaquinone biosynthesis C-methylase UbiE